MITAGAFIGYLWTLCFAVTYITLTMLLLPHRKDCHPSMYVFWTLALVISSITAFLVPFDIAFALQGYAAATRKRMIIVWKAVYFFWPALSWGVIFPLKQFLKSGHWNMWMRVYAGIQRTFVLYLCFIIPAIIFIIYLLASKTVTDRNIIGVLVAFLNTYGTLLIVFLMGYGMVNIPRNLLLAAFPNLRLLQLYYQANAQARVLQKVCANLAKLLLSQHQLLHKVSRVNRMYHHSKVIAATVPLTSAQLGLPALRPHGAPPGVSPGAPPGVSAPVRRGSNASTVVTDNTDEESVTDSAPREGPRYLSFLRRLLQNRYGMAAPSSAAGAQGTQGAQGAQGTAEARRWMLSQAERDKLDAAANAKLSVLGCAMAGAKGQVISGAEWQALKRLEAINFKLKVNVARFHREHQCLADMADLERYYRLYCYAVDKVSTRETVTAFRGPPASYRSLLSGELPRCRQRCAPRKHPAKPRCGRGDSQRHSASQRQALELAAVSDQLADGDDVALPKHAPSQRSLLPGSREDGPNASASAPRTRAHRVVNALTYAYLRHLRTPAYVVCAVLAGAAAAILLYSEVIFALFDGRYLYTSPLYLFFNYSLTAQTDLLCLAVIFTALILFIHTSMFQLRFFNVFHVVLRATDVFTMFFTIGRLPSLTFPLGWNLMMMVGLSSGHADDPAAQTAYSAIMATMSDIPIVGTAFSAYFPVALLVICAAFVLRLDAILLRCLGVDSAPVVLPILRRCTDKVSQGRAAIADLRRGCFDYVPADLQEAVLRLGDASTRKRRCRKRGSHGLLARINGDEE